MPRAFIAVDFVNDFVEGKLGSMNAKNAAERALLFLRKLNHSEEIVFTLDTHSPGDKEFRLWGEHCLKGMWGSQLWDELNMIRGIRLPKGNYDAFYQTDLEAILREKNVDSLFIFGISTDICVFSTVSGAFYRNFKINVIEDLSASLRQEDHEQALSSMKRLFGINILNSIEVN